MSRGREVPGPLACNGSSAEYLLSRLQGICVEAFETNTSFGSNKNLPVSGMVLIAYIFHDEMLANLGKKEDLYSSIDMPGQISWIVVRP